MKKQNVLITSAIKQYAMGTGQWHLRYFNDNNNMSRLLMGKGTK